MQAVILVAWLHHILFNITLCLIIDYFKEVRQWKMCVNDDIGNENLIEQKWQKRYGPPLWDQPDSSLPWTILTLDFTWLIKGVWWQRKLHMLNTLHTHSLDLNWLCAFTNAGKSLKILWAFCSICLITIDSSRAKVLFFCKDFQLTAFISSYKMFSDLVASFSLITCRDFSWISSDRIIIYHCKDFP